MLGESVPVSSMPTPRLTLGEGSPNAMPKFEVRKGINKKAANGSLLAAFFIGANPSNR